jgi:hypothetical protein
VHRLVVWCRAPQAALGKMRALADGAAIVARELAAAKAGRT